MTPQPLALVSQSFHLLGSRRQEGAGDRIGRDKAGNFY